MKRATAMNELVLEGSPAERLASLRARLADAAGRWGHAPPAVVAVSKTWGADEVRPFLDAGQRDFGENRVSEAAEKWPGLRADFPDTRLHLVGQLQSNKADAAVALFDAIHSVDRPSLVMALGKAVRAAGRAPAMFVQLGWGGEGRGGCAVADLPALLARCADEGLAVAGLMTVPPVGVDPASYFALTRKLAARHGLGGLSMGMSGDAELAASLGATLVRVGSALFGGRG